MMRSEIYIIIILIAIWAYSRPAHVYMGVDMSEAVSRNWAVSGAYDNSAAAAELLASTHAKIITFLRYLKHKYHIDETADVIDQCLNHSQIVGAPNDSYAMVDFLLNNYNPETMLENDPRLSTDTSYTIGKGDTMYVCLRQKKNPALLVNPDDLMFVMLHEMAHILNYDNIGHDNIYWRRFKWLLREAVASGIYTPTNYAKYPITYCGLDIAYNPIYDADLKDI